MVVLGSNETDPFSGNKSLFAEIQLARTARTYRRWFDRYLIWIGLVTFAYALVTARIARSWVIADWLINYEAGFIRRGFAGQIAYQLGRMLHLSPVPIVVTLCLLLYGVLLLAVRSLARRSSWNLWVLAALLSPATLAFQVLDATAGFRKELLYLAALTLFLALLEYARWSATGVIVYLSLAILLATLTHESLICFAPYFFAALVVSGRTRTQAAWQCLIPFLLGLGAAYVSARHLGNLQMATQICSSLGYKIGYQGNDICSGGAIPYLASTRLDALKDTLVAIRYYPYFRIYLTTAALAMAPLLMGSRALVRGGRRFEVRAIWQMAALSFAGSLILFAYATDWGRWIYIHVFSIAVLLLYVDGIESEGSVAKVQPVVTGKRKLIACALLVLYATLWTLPHVPLQTPRFGYPALVQYMLAYSQRHALR
jgi:hypothetical protein